MRCQCIVRPLDAVEQRARAGREALTDSLGPDRLIFACAVDQEISMVPIAIRIDASHE